MSQDEETFEGFVAASQQRLLRFAFLLSHDRGLAEDLVQGALIKVYRRWGANVGVDRPEAYVRRIVIHDYVSLNRRRSHHELPMALTDGAVPDESLIVADRDLLWRLLGRLPRRQQAVLVLRFYEDLPDEEIAQILGCARGTVRSLAARALHQLRPQVESADDHAGHVKQRGGTS